MSRRFTRISLLFAVLFTSEVWAIGLGDINLDSALNEPLRAEIVLLAATPEEITSLSVELGSADDFQRYGIDRPFFMQELEFNVVNRGVSGSVVQIRSRSPITEPFLTFLVEATWPSGRLLREYTVLLDPPTYTPPGVQQAAPVQAPVRATPSDSAPIQRQPEPRQEPAPQSRPTSRPAPQPRPADDVKPLPPPDDIRYSGEPGGDINVARGDTLWGIAARMRPDSRLTMNQTMVAIYEANRDAFGGNINMLRAGASLRIPSADEVYRISRGEALQEVQRQNQAWGTGAVVDTDYSAPADTTTRPSLVLVPPDEEPDSTVYDDDVATYEPYSREQEVEDRIAELEAADVPNQQSLIEIRDNELAALREERATLRGEVYEPPVDDVADDPMVDDAADDLDNIYVDDASDDTAADDDAGTDDVSDDAATDTIVAPPTDIVRTTSDADESLVDKVMGILNQWWMYIAGVVVLVIGILFMFMRRGSDDDDGDRPWETLDGDDAAQTSFTETMQAPTPEEAIVVVEQDSGIHPVVDEDVAGDSDTIESATLGEADGTVEFDAGGVGDAAADSGTSQFGSLEDTFSSETAVNLDQTDPIAEADFHMAYGLYDQAADLINGALETDPSDKDLMSKLCEIYFVWGNRDAFVDAATRLKSVVSDEDSAEWNKIVIMGQQIAADHDMFAGAAVAAGATKAVDLAFDDDSGGDGGGLDMDFGADDAGASDIVDLGADDGGDASAIDFSFDDEGDDLDATAETPTIEQSAIEKTAEMPSPTVETPTIEEQFDGLEGTSELPSLDMDLDQAISASGQNADQTAEINLDELDLDIGSDTATELASLDELDDTGVNEAIDEASVTGKNPEIDPNATGVQEALDTGATGIGAALDLDDLDDLTDTAAGSTGLHLAADETGQSPSLSAADESADPDESTLLDATGMTQVLTEDMAVETGTLEALPDDAETMLASMDDDGDDFDFAKTEALPQEAFSGESDETVETQAIAGTDVDLDLDDLTAALQVSDIGGDTIEQPRDDATVEQPRPKVSDETAEIPTMELGPDEMSDDLNEARTMTEVGTKLDLARAYVDMGDPAGARSILEEVLDEGDDAQKQQAQQLLDSLPS
ncbi:MAG: FimV/HubP family polar landmark protein [Pseudomonadota bacterium]